MQLLFALCFIIPIISTASSARILGVFHMGTYSHYQLGSKILKELAARGHEITVITPFEEKRPPRNFKQIILTDVVEKLQEMKKANLFKQASMSVLTRIIMLDMLGLFFTEMSLNHANVQKLLKSNDTFDLVVMEHFLNHAFKGFCHHFNAPCVLSSTVGANRWTNPLMGNPSPPSYVPDIYLYLSSHMTFWERIHNSLAYVLAELFNHLYTFPRHNALLRKYFPGAPHLHDLHYDTPLMLINSHVATNPPVPYVPGMMQIGGFHVDAPKRLPDDLEEYLDNAQDGVVVFSMGSSLKSATMPEQMRNAVLKSFSKLQQRVLMKWDDDAMPNQLANFKLCKWLPQQDVLAHPNVKVFVHHGGLLSIMEGIYHAKPFIGIPIFGDQRMNVANGDFAGYGIGIPFQQLTEETLSIALNETLTNPKYAEIAAKRSEVMHDQPIKQLDEAIFWVEYVLRHRGAPHLKTPALELTWYQYLLLDVFAFIALVVLVLLYALYKSLGYFVAGKLTKK